MIEIIHDAQTGEITQVQYSQEQTREAEKLEAQRLSKIAALENAALLKKNLLDKLGITEDEAKLLLS